MKRSFKEEAKAQRKGLILQEAKRLIIEKGYANLNMDELAEAVGISKPTLYQDFGSKDEIVIRVIQQDYQGLATHLATPHNAPPFEQIKATLRLMLQTQFDIGSLIAGLSPDMISLIRNHNELISLRKRTITYLHNLVDEAKTQHAINSTLPTDIIVRSMLYMQGAIRDPYSDQHYSPQELEKNIADIIHIFEYGVTERILTE